MYAILSEISSFQSGYGGARFAMEFFRGDPLVVAALSCPKPCASSLWLPPRASWPGSPDVPNTRARILRVAPMPPLKSLRP
jgi:hypothetical protein